MRKISQEEFNEAHVLHKQWLKEIGKGALMDFSNCDLSYLDMLDTSLLYANFTRADLTCTNLAMANMRGAIMRDANLEKTNMIYTNFSDAQLKGANFSRASLIMANFSRADLTDVILTNASLFDCIGNNKEIKSISIFGKYLVNYTSKMIWIGCEGHSLEQWKNFNDDEISDMDISALDWWKNNKEFLFDIIEKYPAVDFKSSE